MNTRVPPLCLLLLSLSFATVTASSVFGQTNSPAISGGEIVETDFFATSTLCARCHSNSQSAQALRDREGRAIGPYDLWRTSTMANSTADPFWRAVLAVEVAATPSRSSEIETCLKCHAPMAAVDAELAGSSVDSARLLHGNSTSAKLAADGVSCTVCHQIPAEGLGADSTFSGQFHIGKEGKIFGPHERPFFMPMYRHTGYRATHNDHVRESALCAGCHTLLTHALTPEGSPTGHTLLEQGPYVEWQNSIFNDETSPADNQAASCQDCHVPTNDEFGLPIETRIARNPAGWDWPPVRPRTPFGRHVFTGGNTLVPSILQAEAVRAGDDETAAAFDAVIERTRRLLRHQTARVKIASFKRRGDELSVAVRVENLAGHKLPTAYPSRRVWLRFEVVGGSDRVVFTSGEYDDRGQIVDISGRPLESEQPGGPVAPHHVQIDSSDQVQIYESVMEDSDGQDTCLLLRGARYRKDNRLLPAGWSSDHPRGPQTQPVGTAGDGDFGPGCDTVHYRIDAPAAAGPYRIAASLHYQVLGARHAAELFTHKVREMQTFRTLNQAVDSQPQLLDEATQTVGRGE